jgi:hypothetical protein
MPDGSELPWEPCYGRLSVLIADESSYRCSRCGWIGWPRRDIEPGTGRVLSVYPHPRWYPPTPRATPDDPAS